MIHEVQISFGRRKVEVRFSPCLFLQDFSFINFQSLLRSGNHFPKYFILICMGWQLMAETSTRGIMVIMYMTITQHTLWINVMWQYWITITTATAITTWLFSSWSTLGASILIYYRFYILRSATLFVMWSPEWNFTNLLLHPSLHAYICQRSLLHHGRCIQLNLKIKFVKN